MPVQLKRRVNVYIQGGTANSQTGRMIREHPSDRFDVVESINDARIVVFTGGADINPRLYGEKPFDTTHFSDRRDFFDVAAVKIAVSQKKGLVGICRGAQLINVVANFGRLWQDCRGHALGWNGTHALIDHETGYRQIVNSVHHQMMIPTEKGKLVASCATSSWKESTSMKWHRADGQFLKNDHDWQRWVEDPEVVVYPDTKSLCVQFHPEYGHLGSTSYFYQLLNRYTLKWED